jgi:hypothetical protein
MSYVHISTPRNRLAKIFEGVGGRTIDDMAGDAEVRVQALSSAVRLYAVEQVAEIMRIHRQGEVVMFTQCRVIGTLALNIAETAGAAQMHALGEAARGVCALIDALVTKGVWHADALEAHINTITLFSRDHQLAESEVTRIVDKLYELRASIGVES